MLLENVDVLILVQGVISARRAGSYRIATELRKAGYSCQIVDAAWYFEPKDIMKILRRCIGPNTKLVAWSTPYAYDEQFDQSFLSIRESLVIHPIVDLVNFYVKKKYPSAKIAVGGHSWFRISNCPDVDIAFTGMGDRAIVDCVHWLENRNPFFQYTVNNGKVIVDGDKYNTQWNFNDSEIVYAPEDNILPGESMTIEISRGCIFHCDFCTYNLTGKKSNEYIKLKEVLRQELIRNWEQHGITKYLFSDDTYNDNIVKLQAVAEVVQSLPFELESSTYLRIDLLRAHPEQYPLLRDAGLIGVVFGIESLHHPSSRAIGKGIRPERVIEELQKFSQQMPHTGTTGSFIAGLPYETKESLISWMEQIANDSFPLDEIVVHPLGLMPPDYNRSLLYQNRDKYYVTDSDRPQWWDNGSFDKEWATQTVQSYMQQLAISKRQRVGGFQSTVFQNLGYDRSIIKQRRAEIDLGSTRVESRFQAYRNKLFDNITGI